jgi:hypothetical protein
MCHERWTQRRQEETQKEGRAMWLDFERGRPVVEDPPPPEEPAPIELHEEPVAAGDR